MEKNLVVTNQEVGIMIPPEETLEIASQAAKALKRVVSLKINPVILNGEQYLEFEDLQLLGQFYGYTVRTGDAVPVEVDGINGAKAHADLINVRTGEVIGGAEAYCMRDEDHWNTRPKYDWQGEGDDCKRVKVGDEVVPWFQLASMAQTRAGAKAFRNRLAWVVVLAGYRPTPAEEMTDNTVSPAVKERRTVDKTQHWCELHQANFFKKGRMPGYAHPIEGTKEWCNEPEKMPPQSKSSPIAEPGSGKLPIEDEQSVEAKAPALWRQTTLDWIKETLPIIKWQDITAVSWIKNQFNIGRAGMSLTEVLNLLTDEQRQQFVDHIGLMRQNIKK